MGMKCLRGGKEYNNPIPEVSNPEGIKEIATREWCSDCNALTMAVIFRRSSAYRIPLRKLPEKSSQQPQKIVQGVCPNCGSTLWYQEGCVICHACGYSKCA